MEHSGDDFQKRMGKSGEVATASTHKRGYSRGHNTGKNKGEEEKIWSSCVPHPRAQRRYVHEIPL